MYVIDEINKMTGSNGYAADVSKSRWVWKVKVDSVTEAKITYDVFSNVISLYITKEGDFENIPWCSMTGEAKSVYHNGDDVMKLVNDLCNEVIKNLIEEGEKRLAFAKVFPKNIF